MRNLLTRIIRKITHYWLFISILLSPNRLKAQSNLQSKSQQEPQSEPKQNPQQNKDNNQNNQNNQNSNIEKKNEETAILVKLDGIGDFIMTYSAFLELRKHYKELILVCNTQDYDIAQKLSSDYGLFDKIIPINTKQYPINGSYRGEVNKKLKNLHGDILLTMAYCRPIDMEYIVSRIPAKKKITLSRDTHSKKLHLCDKIYDEIIDEAINEFEICKDFHLISAAIGVEIAPYLAVMPHMSDIDVKSLALGEKYIVISSGGSYNAKKWPTSRYSAVANFILSHFHDYNVVLLGGPGDKHDNAQIYEGIEEQYRATGHVKDLTAQFTLCDCIEIIRKSKAVISNDTSYIHMAVMTGTRSIAVAGGWHWGRFLPYYLGLLENTARRSRSDRSNIENKDVGNKGGERDIGEQVEQHVTLPRAVLHRMDCFNCNGQDKNCNKIGKKGKGEYPCIDNVTTEAVIKAVSEVIDR